MSQSPENDKYKELRQQAQSILSEKQPPSQQNQNQLDRIMHELDVYQVELELQNKELQATQRDLMTSRQELIDLFDFAPLSYLELDREGYIIRANLMASQLLKFERHQLIKTRFTTYIHPSHQDKFYLLNGELLRSGIRQNTDLRLVSAHDTNPIIVHIQIVLVDNESKKVRVSLTDISERKRIEQRLAYLHELDRAIFGLQSIDMIAKTALINLRKFSKFDLIMLMIFEDDTIRVDFVDKDSDVVEHGRIPSHQLEEILRSHTDAQSFESRIPQIEQLGLANQVLQIIPIRHQEALGLLAVRLDEADEIRGDTQLAIEFAVPLGIAIRQATMISRINHYTDELEKLVEERTKALRNREKQYRLLAENATDIVLMHNMDGDCEYISPSVTDKLGYDQRYFLYKGLIHFLHPEETLPLGQTAMMIWLTGRNTLRLRCADGTYLWFESQGQVTEPDDDDEKKIVTILRDVTDRVEAQDAEYKQRIFVEGLLDVTRAINSTLKLDVVMQQIFNVLSQIIPYKSAFFVLLQDDIWRVIHTQNFTDIELEEDIIDKPYDIDSIPVCGEMFETLKSVVINDLEEHNLSHFKDGEGANSFLCVPIVSDEQVVGILNLMHHQKHFYTEQHLTHIEAFAEQASIALRNAQLYAQGQALAALEERQYLARELHDAVSQTLFSAGAIAETLPKLLHEGKTSKLESLLQALEQLTTGARAEMRNLLMELRPSAFEQTNMTALIQQLVQGFRARKTIPISAEIDPLPDLSTEIKMQIFRIIQGALNNIVQHADANSVRIYARLIDQHLILMIIDDGQGFDPKQVPIDRHGLNIMAERAEKLGATFTVESIEGKGTTIEIRLPFENL